MFLSTGFMTTAPSVLLIYSRIVDKNPIDPFQYGQGKLCITRVRTLQLAVTNSSPRSALNNSMFMFAAAAAGALIHMNCFTTMLYIMIVWYVLHVLLFVNISFTPTYMSRTSYDHPQWIPLFQMSCDSPAPHLAESAAPASFLSTHSPIDLLQHFSQSCGRGS
jgi:hypothetical protein